MATDENNQKVIFSRKLNLAIKIKKDGYIPKSGLLVVEELRKINVAGRVLDIGTGEAGILANCLLALGSTEVIATDIDREAVQWARDASNFSSRIDWKHCNLCDEQIMQGDKFDLIVSNPPQMPMPQAGHPHDYGGYDGRRIITRIMHNASIILRQSGHLILLCFDFLGIEDSFNNEPSIKEIAGKFGFNLRILSRHTRNIRKGGKTEENIQWIQTIYPKYLFLKNDQGDYFHEIVIIEVSR